MVDPNEPVVKSAGEHVLSDRLREWRVAPTVTVVPPSSTATRLC